MKWDHGQYQPSQRRPALFCRDAQTAELKLIVATPMTGVIKDLEPQFERNTGHKISAKYVSGPVVKQEIDSARSYDIAISITPVIDALIKEGKLIEPPAPTSHSRRLALACAPARRSLTSAPLSLSSRPCSTRNRLLIQRQARVATTSRAFSSVSASPSKCSQVAADAGRHDCAGGAERSGRDDRRHLVRYPRSWRRIGRPSASRAAILQSICGSRGSASSHTQDGRALINLLTSPAMMPVLRTRGMEPGVPK